MLRQAVKIVPLATVPRAPVLFAETPKTEPSEDTLTKKWLQGLFDEENPKPHEEKKAKSWKDDDDRDGGVMMPIPPGLAGLYFFRGRARF